MVLRVEAWCTKQVLYLWYRHQALTFSFSTHFDSFPNFGVAFSMGFFGGLYITEWMMSGFCHPCLFMSWVFPLLPTSFLIYSPSYIYIISNPFLNFMYRPWFLFLMPHPLSAADHFLIYCIVRLNILFFSYRSMPLVLLSPEAPHHHLLPFIQIFAWYL